jgi:putative ABC transport system permease protein
MRIPTGAELPLALGNQPAVVRVTGQYAPAAAKDRYWVTRPGLTGPIVQEATITSPTTYIATGALDAAGYQAVYDRTDATLNYTWRLPVAPGRFTASKARPVAAAVTELGVTAGNLNVVGAQGLTGYDLAGMQLQTTSGLGELLSGFLGQLRTAQTIVYLVLAGLFAVAFGVLALACRLLTERLRTPLATTRARGASPTQLWLGVSAAVFLVALPAAAAGYGVAVALAPGTASLPGVVAVFAVAVLLPAALAVWTHRRPGRNERQELAGRRATPRQIVLEALAVVLASAGVVALRTRGLSTRAPGEGADPLLAMVPVLLGFAVGMLTLRGYPYPLRLIGRLTARRRTAVPFLGVARAARQGLVATLPVLVLLIAMVVAGFANVVDGGLRRAQDMSAWLTVGADARIEGLSFSAATGDRIRRVRGVRDVLPARVVDSSTLSSPSRSLTVTLVAVDLAAYRRLVADTPLKIPEPPGGSGVPALMSPGLAERIGPGPLQAGSGNTPEVTIRTGGTAESFPGTTGDFVVIPLRALGPGADPTTYFVRGTRLDAAQLRRAVGGDVVVTTYAAVHDRLTAAPMATLVRAAFGYGTLVVAGYAALAVLLMLVIGAGTRAQVVSYLRALGFSRRQSRRLAITELGPVLLCAAVAGWVVGILLPHLVGSAIDLRPYTGGLSVTGYSPDPLTTAALAAGLIAFGGIAIAVDTMISTRRRLGTELRREAQR